MEYFSGNVGFVMDMEKAFDDFINGESYENLEGMLFDLLRDAFISGYIAAGGMVPETTKVIDINREKNS